MLGDRRHRFADPAKRVEVDRRFAAALHAVRGTHAGPASLKPVGLVRAIARAGLEFGVEIGDPLVDDSLRLFLADDALGNQLVGIDRAGRLVLADGLVHQGLREHRFVALIMPEPPVAEHVEHDVGAEGLAEFDRDPCCMYDGFRIVSIDVEDRRHDHFRNIGRIGRGPRIMRARGETDLVVHDDVDGAARAVAAERRKGEGLADNALPGEGRVAMKQDPDDLLALDVVALLLLGADAADDDGIDNLEMRRVR